MDIFDDQKQLDYAAAHPATSIWTGWLPEWLDYALTQLAMALIVALILFVGLRGWRWPMWRRFSPRRQI